MYSYEDRIRAVRLYIKLGKRVAATIHQLGYPTKNALKGWYQEFERCCDLPVGYAHRKPKYSAEQKRGAIEHYLTHDRCVATTIKALGYPGRAALSAWIHELYPETRKRVVGKGVGILHTRAFKQAAIIGLCTREGSAQAVAQKLDVDRTTLYNWKNQLLGREAPASMKRPKDPPPEPERAELARKFHADREKGVGEIV